MSATIRVFELAEICELILDYEEPKDILRASSIRRKTSAIVKGSAKLQAKLFMGPLPEESLRFSRTFFYAWNLDPSKSQFALTHVAAEEADVIAKGKSSTWTEYSLFEINPVIFNHLVLQPRHILKTHLHKLGRRILKYLYLIQEEDSRFSEALEPKLSPHTISDRSSCRAMYLTQPPAKIVFIGANWSHWKVSNPYGVRFGDVLNAADSFGGRLNSLYFPDVFAVSEEVAKTIQERLKSFFGPI